MAKPTIAEPSVQAPTEAGQTLGSRHCAQFFARQAEQRTERLGFCLKCHEIDEIRTELREAVLKKDTNCILGIAQKLSSAGMINLDHFNALIKGGDVALARGVKMPSIMLAAVVLEMEMMRRKSERYEELNNTKRAIVAQNDPELMREFLNELLEEKIIDKEQYERLLEKLKVEGVAAVGNDLNEIFYETRQVLSRKIEIAEAQIMGAKDGKGGNITSYGYSGAFIASFLGNFSVARSQQSGYMILTFDNKFDSENPEQKRAKRQLTELCEILTEYGRAKQEEHDQDLKHDQELEDESKDREKQRIEFVLAHSGHPYAGTFQTYMARLENFSLDYLRLLARAA